MSFFGQKMAKNRKIKHFVVPYAKTVIESRWAYDQGASVPNFMSFGCNTRVQEPEIYIKIDKNLNKIILKADMKKMKKTPKGIGLLYPCAKFQVNRFRNGGVDSIWRFDRRKKKERKKHYEYNIFHHTYCMAEI